MKTTLIVELVSDVILVVIFYNKCCTENVNKYLFKNPHFKSVFIFFENFTGCILITIIPFHQLFLDSILSPVQPSLYSSHHFKPNQMKPKQKTAVNIGICGRTHIHISKKRPVGRVPL